MDGGEPSESQRLVQILHDWATKVHKDASPHIPVIPRVVIDDGVFPSLDLQSAMAAPANPPYPLPSSRALCFYGEELHNWAPSATIDDVESAPTRICRIFGEGSYEMINPWSNPFTHQVSTIPYVPLVLHVVKVEGLPYESREWDILDFFDKLEIIDLLILKKDDGTSLGEAFVAFSSLKDAQCALGMNMRYLGTRYLKIYKANRSEYYAAIAEHEKFFQNMQERN